MIPYNAIKSLGMMLIVALSVSLTNCGGDDEDDKKYSVSRVDTYAFTPPFVYGLYLVNHTKERHWVENTWSSTGNKLHFYVLQGTTFTDIGYLHSKETSISSADTKKAIHVEVPIPTSRSLQLQV